MTTGAPWSVKGIDPKARQVAKDLARRSGMTLGEWLNRVILEDDLPEDVASEADVLAHGVRLPEPARLRLASMAGGAEDQTRVAQALDRLTDRIEASETRTGLAISGIEHSVRQAVSRIEVAEREQIAVVQRLDNLSERLETETSRPLEAGPRSVAALQMLYEEAKVDPSGLVDEVASRLGARLGEAEARTGEALESLRDSLSALDERLRSVEGGGAADLGRRLDALAEDLGRRVEEARAEAAAHVRFSPDGRIDAQLARMSEQVVAVEQRSARAIERMGNEVLALAEALNKRLQGVESQSATAVEQVGGEIVRIGAILESRLAQAEQAQGAALERITSEIGRVSDRVAERLMQSERRAAQAIEDVGEQVARVTERMEHRHERLATDLAERLRESEARATAWMEEARDRIAAQLAGRAAEQPPATPTHAFGPELFARSETEEEVGDHEPGPAEAEPTPAPAYIAADAQPEADAPTSDADFAPLSEPDEDLAFGEPPEPAPQIEERRPLSTREVIEQARLAARAVADQPAPHTAPQPSERRPTKRPARRMFGNLGFRSRVRPSSTWHTALMVAGGAAFLSVGAAGVVLMEGPGQRASQGLAAPGADAIVSEPRAAVALAPAPLGAASGDAIIPVPAQPAETPQVQAEAYVQAVRDIRTGKAGGLASLKQIAESGYAPAEFYLAKLYETGQFGVVKNAKEARRWTEAAANGGDRWAMHNLALYYFRGEGGPQDLAESAAWFRRAAEAGVVDSQYNLGLLYETGSGVEKNLAEAYKWFSIAADGGDGQARVNAVALESKLSPAALAAAEKAASVFRPDPDPSAQAQNQAQTSNLGSVSAAQRALSRLGYYDGPMNGTQSSKLEVAVAAYQRDHGLPATGRLDPGTVSRLSVFTR